MKIILLRHGESEWNLANKFTGWTNVGLTKNGINEAKFAAQKILDEKIDISQVYTSILKRAIETKDIVINIIGFPESRVQYDWRLNERHYGALQGLNKAEIASKYGEEQVKIWRRSYDTPPPLLSEDDKRHPKFDNSFSEIDSTLLPLGESLENVVNRLKPFWKDTNKQIEEYGGSHLIIAHSNSLRAIVKILDQLSDEEIISVNIPTGVPLVYTFDQSLNVLEKEYLINEEELKVKQEMVANQGKAK